MKKFLILLIFVLTFIVTTPHSHALFGRIAMEKQRRLESEQKLSQQEQTIDRLKTTSSILSVGCVFMLVLGAAVGSRKGNNEPRR